MNSDDGDDKFTYSWWGWQTIHEQGYWDSWGNHPIIFILDCWSTPMLWPCNEHTSYDIQYPWVIKHGKGRFYIYIDYYRSIIRLSTQFVQFSITLWFLDHITVTLDERKFVPLDRKCFPLLSSNHPISYQVAKSCQSLTILQICFPWFECID